MRPYPPSQLPPLTRFDYIMLVILMIILTVFNLTSCNTPRQCGYTVDSDLCKHVLIKETCQCTKCGIMAVDPFTYSPQIVEPEFEEFQPSEYWPETITEGGRVTLDIDPQFDQPDESTVGLQEWEAFGKVYTPIETDDDIIEWHGYIIIDTGDSLIVIKNNESPKDTLTTECQHTNVRVMRTLAGCSPPNNKCNTCTCLDCGYSYNCN